MGAHSILTEEGMSEALEQKLLISILAGTTMNQLKSWAPTSCRVVRAMPNTPCKIREGMTVVTPPPSTSSFATWDRKILTSLFSPIGRCRFLEEKHFDACTALSGSGPAIKDSVTTPGGCTIAGLLTLEDGKVRSTIARCIQTATQHASGLGGSKDASGFKK